MKKQALEYFCAALDQPDAQFRDGQWESIEALLNRRRLLVVERTGWASQLPVRVRMQDLPRDQQPQSDDPDFWQVWTGKDSDEKPVERSVDWKALADDWQGKTAETDESEDLEGTEGAEA